MKIVAIMLQILLLMLLQCDMAVILYGDKKEKGGITLWSNPLLFEEGKIRLVEQASEQKEEAGEDSGNRNSSSSSSSSNGSSSNGSNNNNTNNNEGTATAINYIQAKFRAIDENNNTKKNHDAGIKWTDERKNEYYAALRNDRLELELKQGPDNTSYNRSKQEDDNNNNNSNNSNDTRYYFQNREIKLQNGIWYTLEVVVTQNTINVYVDNILAIKAPRVLSDQSVLTESGGNYNETGNDDDNTSNRSKEAITSPPNGSISRIGIRSFHNTAEFQPVVIGHISSPEIILDSANYQQEVYHHYYPVSLLALSDMKYETFAYGDYSALSKKYVILPFDPLPFSSTLSSSSSSSNPFYSNDYSEDQNHTINRYLEYANSGGNLVIIHSDKNFDGMFSKLLSIKPSDIVEFDNIVNRSPYDDNIINGSKPKQGTTNRYAPINISGFARDINFVNSSQGST